jgi:hypothetical protein
LGLFINKDSVVACITEQGIPMARRQASPKTVFVRNAPKLALSDDECVQRLAALIEQKDDKKLSEIVSLISRLAVTIE